MKSFERAKNITIARWEFLKSRTLRSLKRIDKKCIDWDFFTRCGMCFYYDKCLVCGVFYLCLEENEYFWNAVVDDNIDLARKYADIIIEKVKRLKE